MDDCVFCKIINQTLPTDILFEDEHCIVIQDHRPLTPVHLLIISRKHVASLNELQEQDEPLAGHMLLVAKKVAQQRGFADKGYRLVINTGAPAGQTVFHLHIHILSGSPSVTSLTTRGMQ